MSGDGGTGRALLYLDVDGPLNPYAAQPERRPEGYTTHRMKPDGWIAQHPGLPPSAVKPLRVWLNPGHGRALLALSDRYDLVWATTWRQEANTFIAPVLGLPALPVVDWPTTLTPGPNGTFWKTRHLVTHARGRPFAWLDDELDDQDRRFVTAHHAGPALLHRVDPRLGLREADFAELAAFARSL
ncbi:HAD domain-containing protein [Streptomyces pseudovenezuelae]|uniref:HAD domain-containing protein n=1 Tax=Streptomyces pseudovenezuelae TaxID=67350 RepID=A0ABZ1WWB2_9ACTN|nr:HAD domain-containing protein [Streptomyces pseudovenezuelae]